MTSPRKRFKRNSRSAPSKQRIRKPFIRTRTAEEIWECLSQDGPKVAEDRLRDYLPGESSLPYAVDDLDSRARRRQAPFHYVSFGPPSWFEAPYVILKVDVNSDLTKFISHAGEELLCNLEGESSGDITYSFGWPAKASNDLWSTTAVVAPGEAIRINPSLPHLNSKSGSPTAWIIFRPLSNSPASLFVHADGGKKPSAQSKDVTMREFTKQKIDKMGGGQFLLLGSGIFEKMKIRRLRSELSVQDLALLSNLNKYYVARMERLELDNVSIANICEIAKQIDVDLTDLVAPFRWAWKKYPRSAPASGSWPLPKPRALGNHFIHAARVHAEDGKRFRLGVLNNIGDITSWIVLRGQMLPLIPGSETTPLIKEGHVFHARRGLSFDVQALGNLDMLEIRYSTVCSCGDPQKEQQGEYPGLSGTNGKQLGKRLTGS
jgi:transcriptional regulator with XRE-family HTH domain